ncbi:uncharacterized protein LOC141750283 isoform X1 [Larus michahellis]|uniref:uncharacterized protein LOC141750283 isoform X1 n=1 Tax=Larus michahellis TaxID=119627 RepID=UPI003D9B41BF
MLTACEVMVMGAWGEVLLSLVQLPGRSCRHGALQEKQEPGGAEPRVRYSEPRGYRVLPGDVPPAGARVRGGVQLPISMRPFKKTITKYAIIFIAVQYNVTYTTDDNSEQFHFYDSGPKDIATIFFYMLIAINLHAVIQEYILNLSGKILLYLPDSLLASCTARALLSKDPEGRYSEPAVLYLPLHCSYLWCLYIKFAAFGANSNGTSLPGGTHFSCFTSFLLQW